MDLSGNRAFAGPATPHRQESGLFLKENVDFAFFQPLILKDNPLWHQFTARLHIGIGIATGDVIAGYTGTRQRATYTCVGNAVNLAARLEAHTRVAGYAILLDEGTRELLQGGVRAEGVDAVHFKGMTSAVSIFSVTQKRATPRASD